MGNTKYPSGFAPLVMLLYGGVIVIVVLAGFLGYREYQLKQKSLGVETTAPTILPTSPTMTQTPKPVVTKTTNPDPIIDCESSYPNCKGTSIKVRKSQCSNITCCGFRNGIWKIYVSVSECKKAQAAEQPAQQAAQPTSGANYHCYNSTKDYWYYTSLEQCNSDNAQSSSFKNCMDTQDAKFNTCSSVCKSELDYNSAACAWAYTGPNAAIEQNSEKYGECLNGPDQTSAIYAVCLGKCGDQHAQDIKQCI